MRSLEGGEMKLTWAVENERDEEEVEEVTDYDERR